MRTLKTKRLILRDWTNDDVQDLYAYAKSLEVGPMAGWKPHESMEESKQFIEDCIQEQEVYAIVHKETNKVIGSIGLHHTNEDNKRELGYVIAKEYWGQGFAKEAAVAAMKDLFEHNEAKTVTVCHFRENIQSKRVIEKIGFHSEPDKIQTVKIFDGSVKEEIYYVMDKDEFCHRYVGDQNRYQKLLATYHHMMKGYTEDEEWMEDVVTSDQAKKRPVPELVKSYPQKPYIKLSKDFTEVLCFQEISYVIESRRSHRNYLRQPMTLEQLSYLLWVTQGCEDNLRMRMAPSAGARHPLETYVAVKNVEGLVPGLYTYHIADHTLILLKEGDLSSQLTKATCGQEFFGTAPVSFLWSVIPYRSEWRYCEKGPKYALLDAGHVCQNLYLGATAIGCGACAIGCYDQEACDELLGIGKDEFTVYMASVGRIKL